MIRHIVAWKHSDENSYHQNHTNAVKIKKDLEGLLGVIDGMSAMEVIIDPLESSNRDIILTSLFDDVSALENYQKHPKHKEISEFIKSVTKDRATMDYIE